MQHVSTIQEQIEWLKSNKIGFPQVIPEFSLLLDQVQEIEPKVIVEIGSRSGGSFFVLTTLLKPDLAISIDLPEAEWGKKNSLLDLEFVLTSLKKRSHSVESILGDSHATYTMQRLIRILNGRPIDFLFLDGDHTYEGVKKDFEMYAPFVRDGGLIAFHDLIPPPSNPKNVGVDRLWEELKSRFLTKEFVFLHGIGLLTYKK